MMPTQSCVQNAKQTVQALLKVNSYLNSKPEYLIFFFRIAPNFKFNLLKTITMVKDHIKKQYNTS